MSKPPNAKTERDTRAGKTTMPEASRGVLAGIRVLDFTSMIAGPYCTRMLADLGAEVIKCEPPGGDLVRATEPRRDGHSSYFGHLNCGKKSICLDLKHPAARAVAIDLADRSDVVVENFRPGVMARLGLDYPALRRLRPDIVYCAISGYGQSGPDAGLPAYAPIIHAASGFDLANLRYQDEAGAPMRTGLFVADYLGGMTALAAIQSALLHRACGGEGQMIDVALLDVMISMMSFEVQAAQFPVHEATMVYGPARARDGFIIALPITQANFESLARATGNAHWTRDPRFADFAARKNNWQALMDLLEAWTAERPAVQCERIISEAGCPCSRYRTVGEAIAGAQSLHRGLMATAEDGAGSFEVTGLPWRMSAMPTGSGASSPVLGQHGPAILTDVLGYGPAQVEELLGLGALRHPGRPVSG
ncbi:MAG: CoA transferase [Alphaproteobacteria bacterium]|nr:MAG: CoA transferase [Alphaproteobacteria bacterium]